MPHIKTLAITAVATVAIMALVYRIDALRNFVTNVTPPKTA